MPFLLEDMVTVLVTAANEPLRVLADGSDLYAKDQKRLGEALMLLPEWLISLSDRDDTGNLVRSIPASAQTRVRHAIYACQSLQLIEEKVAGDGKAQMVTTDAGSGWLASDLKDRIRHYVEPWRTVPTSKAKQPQKRHSGRAPELSLDGFGFNRSDPDESVWMPDRLSWASRGYEGSIDWRAAFADLLADADGQFVSVPALLDYHSRVNNPLLGRREKGSYGRTPRLRTFYRADCDELTVEAFWNEACWRTITDLLLPLGGVELGASRTDVSVRLHSIGRYMLGLANDFECDAPSEGTVIIQPNFEVTFLGAAPHAEANIGRLAERTGARSGTLFKITRSSILAAAAAGITAEAAIDDLAKNSSKSLPENVDREIRGWFAATRRVSMRSAWIIDSPDAETSAKVLAAAGKHAQKLSDTVVEIRADAKKNTLVRKLKQAGVFVR